MTRDRVAEVPEPEPRFKQRDELRRCHHGALPVGARIVVMSVVHHDDVAVGGTVGEPAREFSGLTAATSSSPTSRSSSRPALTGAIQARVIAPPRQPACGRKRLSTAAGRLAVSISSA